MEAHPTRFREICRMNKFTFDKLHVELCEVGLSGSSFISSGEKLLTFLYMVSKSASNRTLQERFQHSGETISRILHEVTNSILAIYENYMKPPNIYECSAEIYYNPKFYPPFKNAIGAIDGSHIAISVPVGCKDDLYSIYLLICNN
jgi:hypothetical protein